LERGRLLAVSSGHIPAAIRKIINLHSYAILDDGISKDLASMCMIVVTEINHCIVNCTKKKRMARSIEWRAMKCDDGS
jgi:hypothetical protein